MVTQVSLSIVEGDGKGHKHKNTKIMGTEGTTEEMVALEAPQTCFPEN